MNTTKCLFIFRVVLLLSVISAAVERGISSEWNIRDTNNSAIIFESLMFQRTDDQRADDQRAGDVSPLIVRQNTYLGQNADSWQDIYLGQKNRRNGSGGCFWANAYYNGGSIKPIQTDVRITPGMYGIQAGFDFIQGRFSYSSLFFNYSQSDSKIGGAKSNISNYFVGFGRFFSFRPLYVGYSAGIGYDDYKARGYLEDFGDIYRPGTEISEINSLKGNGLQTSIFGEIGLDLFLGKWGFRPFYSLQYDFVYHGRIGTKEIGYINDQNDHSLLQYMGLRINWKAAEEIEFQARGAWVHEMLDNPPPFYNMRFSRVLGMSTPSVYYYKGNTGRDWAWIGAGVKFEYVFNISLLLDYDLLINQRLASHNGNIGLSFSW
ncbi:MAG: autotransporter outer membrane beta-barrel domain-containing protein [Thermoguttaceae bacterium]